MRKIIVAALFVAMAIGPSFVQANALAAEDEDSLDVLKLQDSSGGSVAGKENLQAIHNTANKYLQEKKYTEALVESQKLVALAPDYPKGYWGVGLVYYFLGDFVAAIDNFKHSIEIAPDDSRGYMLLGIAYKTLGDKVAAKTEWLKMVELEKKRASNPKEVQQAWLLQKIVE